MPRFNKRGSFGEEEPTTSPVTSLPHSRPSVITGPRGRDEVNCVTQNIDNPKDPHSTDKTTLEEYEHSDNVSMDDFPADELSGSGNRQKHSPGSGPLHPGTILAKHKPSLQRLEDLPGLSVVTWEDFLDNPSAVCGLFEVDREEFIHYNPEQVNVFFHDSRMEQPTLGAPSGDGLSWTIFIDNYKHLKSVRTWLTERVSVILLQLLRPKGQGSAACLVAINPTRKAVGSRLHDTFSRAVDAFLQQRNFCIEIDLNSCVQSWCRTTLNMSCEVKGGRVVITNAEERMPCSRVDSVPFCVACFPVWGIRKLSYKYKREAEYEDIFLAFTAEDLSVDNKAQTQFSETNTNINNNAKSKPTSTKSSGNEKSQVWMKKNKCSTSIPTHTTDTVDRSDVRANLEIEEVDSGDSRQEPRRGPKRYNSKKDKERGQDSGFSSDNASAAERSEPQLSKGIPNYRPHSHVPPRPSDKAKRTSRHQRNIDDASSTSASTSYASSVLSPGGRDGTPTKPAASISWQVIQDEEEEVRDSEWLNLPSNGSSQDSTGRAELARVLSMVEPDDEEGDYTLVEESPLSSPRPDTPYHKPLASTSLKGKKPVMMSQGAIIREERSGNRAKESPGYEGPANRSTTTGNFPEQRSSLRVHVNLPAQEQSLYARDNEAFDYDQDSHSNPSKLKQNLAATVLKEEKSRGSKAFPYTSDYLDAIGGVKNHTPSYGLIDQDVTRGDELRKKKTASTVGNEPFIPRDNNQYKLSTHDMEDVEDDISVMSDEDEMMSSQVRYTTGQLHSTKPKNTSVVTWDIDSDQDDEDEKSSGLPRVLPGAKGAQQLRSSKEFPAQNAGGEIWRRGGQQNDSRRRYIALNSLRRKSNQQALQADLRKQKQQDTPIGASDLIEL